VQREITRFPPGQGLSAQKKPLTCCPGGLGLEVPARLLAIGGGQAKRWQVIVDLACWAITFGQAILICPRP